MAQLKTDLPRETREDVTYAFREMLRNAIEYGGKNDPASVLRLVCTAPTPAPVFRAQRIQRDPFAPGTCTTRILVIVFPSDHILHLRSVARSTGPMLSAPRTCHGIKRRPEDPQYDRLPSPGRGSTNKSLKRVARCVVKQRIKH